MTDDELFDQEQYEEWAERQAAVHSLIRDVQAGVLYDQDVPPDLTTGFQMWEEEQAAWWDDGCSDVRFS